MKTKGRRSSPLRQTGNQAKRGPLNLILTDSEGDCYDEPPCSVGGESEDMISRLETPTCQQACRKFARVRLNFGHNTNETSNGYSRAPGRPIKPTVESPVTGASHRCFVLSPVVFPGSDRYQPRSRKPERHRAEQHHPRTHWPGTGVLGGRALCDLHRRSRALRTAFLRTRASWRGSRFVGYPGCLAGKKAGFSAKPGTSGPRTCQAGRERSDPVACS